MNQAKLALLLTKLTSRAELARYPLLVGTWKNVAALAGCRELLQHAFGWQVALLL
jgi:hypothetical protein